MCTIAGYWSKNPINSSYLISMMETMEHRGPDAHGLSLDGNIYRKSELSELSTCRQEAHIGLGHSRLHIIGNEALGQPYQSCDGNLQLIHNGEIYNYPELTRFIGEEHHVKTTADSEILVHLLEESYQGDLLEAMRQVQPMLDGMYAIAVTDGKSIVLARDPAGKKPLYYQQHEGTWFFASERKALEIPGKETNTLPPGHRLRINYEGIYQESGVSLPYPQLDIDNFRDAVDLYKKVLVEAVNKRLTGINEAQIGVIFSGGIDSVLIAKLLCDAGQKVVCYCTGDRGSGDVDAALQSAHSMNLDLRVQPLSEISLEEIVPEIMHDVEEKGLLQVEVAIPMYLAAKAASQDGIRVMFTGQAADELFAGYDWYRGIVEQYGYVRLHEQLWRDINALSLDTLEREDKLTMAHSIELRVPYLDRDVVYAAMRILPQLKIHGAEDYMRKHVHRQAALELGVPKDLAFRRKDPAQSGSGIHQMLEKMIAETETKASPLKAKANLEADKGSLYRYDLGDYGSLCARTYLENVAEQLIKEKPSPLNCALDFFHN